MILSFTKVNASTIKLSKHLLLSEYECKCSYEECTRSLVQASTVKSFSKLRAEWGSILIVTSAFRCQRHNKHVGGTNSSYHKIGAAMDLRPNGNFTVDELDRLEEMARKHFDVVLRYEGFIHCHNIDNDMDGNNIIGEH